MLQSIIDVLADPTDGSALALSEDSRAVVSATGHSYDIAKQGYVSLFGNDGRKFDGDSLEMIEAREAFLSRGHFAPFVEAVSAAVRRSVSTADDDAEPVIAEIGAGTGFYLSHTLDDVLGSRGVGMDISVPAAKKLATAHPRLGAVVADAWERLPLLDNSVDVVTSIFAPRNAPEFARVLKPEGEVVVLTGEVGHLAELREPLGILDVEPGKVDRMVAQAEGYLELVADPQTLSFSMNLDREAILAQVGMSPSARHIDREELKRRVDVLPDSMTITARATLTLFRPLPR